MLQRASSLSSHLFKMASKSTYSTTAYPGLAIEKAGDKLLLTLENPSSLNTLTNSVLKGLYKALKGVDDDPSTSMVVIRGAGDKAFSAGGDLVEGVEMMKGGMMEELRQRCRAFYCTMYAVSTVKKPVISITNGFALGAGCSLATLSRYTVATETSVMAMPENVVGLYPENGSSYFLPRLPGELGTYLGLTGSRLKGEELVDSGLATHFIMRGDGSIRTLEKDLFEMQTPSDESIINLLDAHHSQCYRGAASRLSELLERVEKTFCHDTIEEIINALENNSSDWSRETISALNSMSPTALKISLKMLREGRNLSLFDCLAMELRLGCRYIAQEESDFTRGIYALLIDKTRKPVWSPSTLDEVDMKDVDEYFKPLPGPREFDGYLDSNELMYSKL